MSIYRTHILVPVDEGTVQSGAFEVKRKLEQAILEKGLENEIKVVESGTVGILGKSVILVVYPERVCYTNVRPADVALIVDEHLLKGRIPSGLKHFALDIPGGSKAQYSTGLTRQQKRVVLDKGKVAFETEQSSYAMSPGQQIEYDKITGKITLQNLMHPSNLSLWKNNVIFFYDTPLAEVIKVLERRFNVEFNVQNQDVLNYSYTITTKQSSIDSVMKELQKIAPVKFHLMENQVHVSK